MKFAFRWYGDGDAASLAAFFRRNYSNSGEGERALTRGKSSRNRHRIGVRSLSRAIEFTFGLTFSNGSRLNKKEKIFESFYIHICLNSLFFTPKFRDSYFYIYDKYIFELQNARGDFLTSFPRVEINKNNKSCDIN